MGVRHSLFPEPALGAPRWGLPASRRHSPRQAELSASWQGRPEFCNVRILSEAFELASAGGCAAGLQTRPRHACDFFFASWPHVLGRPSLLAMRSPTTTGLASSLSSCLSYHSPAVSFLTSPALGSFSRNVPGSRVLPAAEAHFVRLSASFAGGSNLLLPPEPAAPC